MSKTPVETEGQAPEKARRKRGLLKKILLGLCVLLFIVLAGVAGFLGWVCQSQSGQEWLARTLNAALAPKDGGLGFRISSLSGSLPFNFDFGLECADKSGVWLKAPKNHFTLNWKELPGTAHISAIEVHEASLERFPEMPPDEKPEEPAKPFSIHDLQGLIDQGAGFLNARHWWLPNIIIDGVKINRFLLPPRLLPENPQRLALDAALDARLVDGAARALLTASAANDNGSAVNLGTLEFTQASTKAELSLAPEPGRIAAKAGLEAAVDAPLLKEAGLPADYLGQNINFNLDVDLEAAVSPHTPAISAKIQGPSLNAGNFQLQGNGAWQSGPGWKDGELDGPLELTLAATANPMRTDDPALNILRSPAAIEIKAYGTLPEVALALDASCAEAAYQDHRLEDFHASLATQKISLPLSDKAMKLLANENEIDVTLSALLDKEKISLSAQPFFQSLGSAGNGPDQLARTIWRAGLRNLKLDALGIEGAAQLVALLAPEASPALDGQLDVNIRQWKDINKFVPDQAISGDVELALKLDSGLAQNGGAVPLRDDFKAQPQKAEITLVSRKLDIAQKGSKPIELGGIQLNASASDLFHDLSFNAALRADKINAAGFGLSARANAKGALAGPIAADISTTGAVASNIAATWEPGKAKISALGIQMDSAKLMGGKGRGTTLGIKLSSPAELSYGDDGISIKNLDAVILPSGRLRAAGGVSPDKLDFSLNLENLAFKPWQKISPQIPEGSANLRASLKGTPARPGGNFLLAIAGLKIPGASLAPISFSLAGGVRNQGAASALNLRLSLDSKTLQALGGSMADVSARVPLLFGADGVPRPDMNGQLAAAVRWDGALGPIWNILPIADQRLNGRFAIDIKASGKLNAPRIQGGVRIDKGRYENLLYGVLLTDIGLRLDLTEKGAASGIKEGLPGGMTLALSLSDGRGGTVNVDGKGDLDGSGLDIKARINRLKPLRRRDIHIELSGNAAVTGSATAPDISGEITVNRGEVLLDNLDIASTSVVTLNITDPAAQKKSQEEPAASSGGHLDVRIVVPPRFTVEGRGLGSVWRANLLISGTLAEPKITGTINADSGNFDFLGKNFALTKGIVTFAGGSLANPLLDIELTNETPDLTAHIYITGPVNKMRLTLSSDPTLPRDDILSRVLFGKSVNELSRLEALQLAGAVAQLAGFGSGGGLLNSAKKALGVDVLRIGTSSSDAAGDGDEGAGGTNIEMGKYITDKLYMGVQQGLQENSTAFIIQYELTPRTSVEVRSEDNNTWGGLKWKYDY